MADNLLASILSGSDPLAPQILPGYMGSQYTSAALDNSFGMNAGPFGALAKTLAGVMGGNAMRESVPQVTAARTAALPELAKLYASDDPYKELASNPGSYSPVAMAQLLAGASPEAVAKARLLNTQVAQAGLNLKGYQGIPALAAAGQAVPAPLTGRNAGAATPGTQATFPQAYTGRPQQQQAPAQPAAATAEPDMGAIASMPAPQQAEAVKRMLPSQKAALAALIAKLQAGRGGANGIVRP